MTPKNGRQHPLVFISYSHDSPEHADRVLALSNRLREDGIDCILDQYEDSPPEGWPRWTEKQIHEADFVLMVCTEVYYKRVMGKEKPGTGQGVRWEGNVIYQLIYDADSENAKFLPALFADGQASYIPMPLKGATRYFIDTAEGYELLYRRLTNQPRVRKPGLGDVKRLPAVQPLQRKQDFASRVQGLWPGLSLPHGGPKISEPFAGRQEELKELAAGMGGDKSVVAVVGLAGQGKSCLVGEWYNRGARPPQGIGLVWRKVYEAGYTFDRFLDELHLYLASEPIDRMQIKTVRDRAAVVEGLLAAKPCWIVLDGVERWLKRWASEPDVDVKHPTRDDRAGCEPALDGFLKGAWCWENGSRLLLTTRAVPSAIDESPLLMIGRGHGHEKRLTDLKPEEAIGLLDGLDVRGTEDAMREAASAYGCHAYAVHVLGALIRDLYGGDVSRWKEVSPLGESRLADLFERIIETCEDDLPLLELVACSLGAAPVEMLAELTARDETSIRKSLAGLKKWQMVEFEGTDAEQHTVVRQFLIARMGADAVKARCKQIAAWWAQRKTPANPTRIEEIRPRLRAVEHLVAASDPDAATRISLTKPSPESYYTVNGWLRAFGYLDENIRINGLVIQAYVRLIEQEGRRELRNNLASCYNNRGLALAAQGHLKEAIDDYGRAIEIREGLVEEGQRHILGSLLQTLGSRCRHAKELGDPAKATQGANEAMRCFLEEVGQNRTTEPLLKAAAGFAEAVRGSQKLLLKHGLDAALWRSFQSSLTPPPDNQPPPK
jgi:tetratricopeptide (TPR) repeat protein